MLLVMMVIAMVLAWVLDGKQRKQAVSLLLCAAMMSSYIPAINVAKADSVAKPVLVNEQVLVNGTKMAQIGAVTYSETGSAYTLDTSSDRVRVKNGDSISFEGTISAPEGETISWVRVDVYDANTEEPYTVGAEYYRADGLRVQQYDLANIPALTIGEAFGRKDYTLAEGGKYIVMFCVGDSNGNTFSDMDTVIEDNQGPAILVDVKLSPSNCKHPHSDYVYILHSSGEVRKQSYGDSMTHQVEPLYERYCGLCDTFLMNIWGEGTSEEHSMDSNGVCLGCGYSSISIAKEADSPYSTAIMMEEFTVTPPILMLGESAEVTGAISGYGSLLKDVKVYVYKKGDHTQGGVSSINESNVDTYYYELNGNQIISDTTYGNLHMGVGTYDVVLSITDENGKGFENQPTATIEVVEKEEDAIFINSHQEVNTVEVGDRITVTWTNANSYSYIVDSVRLDGEPAYSPEEEAGYSLGVFETQQNNVTFSVSNIDAGKYQKITIWGVDENGEVTQEPDYAYFYVKGSDIEGPSLENFSVSPEEISEGESFAVYGTVKGNGDYLKTVRVLIWNVEDETLGGCLAEYADLNQLSFELGFAYSTGIDIGNTTLGEGSYIVEVTAEDENGEGFEERQIHNIFIGPRKPDSAVVIESHNDGDEIDENDEVEITWESGKSERYVVNAIVLDGVPAYSEDESGTVLHQDLITSGNSYTFVAPWVNATIETERWVKISIYGISGENDNVTEMQTTVYLKTLPILDYFSYRIDAEGNAIIGSYNGTESDVSIPAEIDGRVVIGIDSSAFNGTEIKNLHLPSTINWIGEGAFASSSLNSVNIPEGVKEIPASAFHGCSELTSVSLPSSITSIGEYAFYLCSALTDIDLPSSVNSIGAYAFSGCRNANGLSLPRNLEDIGEYAFSGSGITQLDIPDGMNSIPDYAFKSCSNLNGVTIPPNIVAIGEEAFLGSAVTSIVIPATVTNIGENAFVRKGLSSSATIYGYYNSAAQEHADEYYITFVALDNVETGLFLDNFSLSSESVTEGESISIKGNVVGNGVTISSIAITIKNAENEELGGYIVHETGLNLSNVDLRSYGEFETGTMVGNTVIGPGRYIVEVYATDENGNGLLDAQQRNLTVTEHESNATANIWVDRNYAKVWDIISVGGTVKSGDYYLKKVQVSVFTDNSGVHGYLSDTAVKEFDYEDQVKEFDLSDLGAFAIKKTFICEAHGIEEAFPSGNALITVYVSVYGPDGDEEANEFGTSASEELLVVENSIYPWIKGAGIARDTIDIDDPIQLSGQICDDFGLAELYIWVEPVGEGMNLSWSQPIEGTVYDLGNVILSPGIDIGWWSPGLYTVSIDAMNTNGRCFESGRVTIVGLLTIGEEVKEITLGVDKTEINAGESVTFTAQSDADSVTLYIEAYNEVAGEWYVAVTKEMTKNGSEFTYTHEFANAGSKRVYAKTTNGTTSDTIEITANALKETLEAPVGGTMTATVGEEVAISWGAVANATGYTAHLYEMVDGQLESIGDVTDLIEGTSLKYTFAEAGEYHVGVTATAEGYNPSEQSAVIVTVEEETDKVIFTSHNDGNIINIYDNVTVEWDSNYMYNYHWEIKILDGEPAYMEEEEGTVIDKGNYQGMGYRFFKVPITAAGKWVRVRVHAVNAVGAMREYPSNLYLKVADYEITPIEFTSHSTLNTMAKSDTVVVQWSELSFTDSYIVNVKILDGEPAYSNDESGKSIVTNSVQRDAKYNVIGYADAVGKWIKLHVSGQDADGNQTETGNAVYFKVNCNHSDVTWKEITTIEPLPENTAEYHTHHAVVVTKHAYCNDCDVTDSLDDLYPPQEVSRNNDLHQLTDGDCLLCGYEATFVPECEHLNKVIDESTIVVEKQTENEHTISYWYFCNDCKTLLNNVVREENTAVHTFDASNVCTVCGYTKNPQNLPTMTFAVDKTTVNAGEEIEFTFTMTGGSPMANKVMLYAEDKYILTVGAGEEYNFDFAPAQGVFTWKYKFNQAGLRKIHFVPLYEDATTRVEGIKTAVQEIQVSAYLNLLMSGVPQDTSTRKIALTVYDNGGSGTPITVDSNVAWSVKTDVSWIKLTADTANKQILHEYEVNNTGVARVGTITVSAPGCEDWVITCTQETVPMTWGMWTDGSYVKIQASGSAMNPNHKYIAHVYLDGSDKCLKEVELEKALSEFHYYNGLGVVRGNTYRVQIEEKDANGTTLRTSGIGTFKLSLYATLNNIMSGNVDVTNTKEIAAGDSISFKWDGSLGLDAYVYAVINGTRITLHNGKSGTSAVTETISASQYEHLLTSDRTKIDIYVEVESLKKSWSGSIVKKQNSENYDVWYRFTGENDQSDHKASGTIYVYPDWVDYVTIWATNDSGEWIQPRKYGILSAQKDEYYFEVSGDTDVIEYSKSAQGFLVKSEGSATVRIMQNNKLIVSVDVAVGARSSGGLNIDGNQYYVKLKYTDDNGKTNSLEYGKAAASGASFGRLSQIRTMRDSVNVELEIVNANGYGLSVYDFTELYWTVQGDFVQGQGDNFTLQLPWVMTPDNGARYTFTLKQKQTLADKELIKFDVDVLYSDEFFERYSLYSDDLVFGDRYALEMGVDAYTVLHQSAREVTFKCKDNLTGEFKQINSYDSRNKFGVKAEWGLEKTDGCSILFQGTGIQTITLYRGNAGPLALPVASLKIAILDSQPTLQENLLDFEKNIVQAQNYFEAEKASDLRNEINNSIDALGKSIEDAISFIDPNKRYEAEAKDVFDADNIEYIMYLNRSGGLGHSAVLLTDERGNSLIVSFYPDENAVWGEKVYNTGETRMRYLSAFETFNLVYGENGGELSDLYERNTAAGGNLMSNNYWNSYGYRTEEAYTRGSVKAVDNNTGRSMYDTCIGLFGKETKYNAIWQNCDDIALSIFAEDWYEQENIEGRIPNLTPGQTFDALESLGYESVEFGNEPASALPVGIIQLHNSATRTDNHIQDTAVNVVDAVVKAVNSYDEYFSQRVITEGIGIFDQEEARKYFGEEAFKQQLKVTLDAMYPLNNEVAESIKTMGENAESITSSFEAMEVGDYEFGGIKGFAEKINRIVGDDNFISSKDVEFFEMGAGLTDTVVSATNHLADSYSLILAETETRIATLERIKTAAVNSKNQELADAATALIDEYKNKEEKIAVDLGNKFVGWVTNETLQVIAPPYKIFTDFIDAGQALNDLTGLTESANAHEAATYGNNIEYSIILGCMVDIEKRNANDEYISVDEWENYYVMAEFVYNSRIKQIDALLNTKDIYIADSEETRLTHARNVLVDGLKKLKKSQEAQE